MYCSTIVGILSNKREVFKEDDGEILYKSEIVIRGNTYPIIGYATALKDNLSGKVAVECYLKSERVKGKLFTYIRAVIATESTIDAEETSMITIKGFLVKKMLLAADIHQGMEIQNFILRYRDCEGNQNLVHAIARGKLARAMDKKEINETVIVTGILWAKKKTLELEVREVN